MRTARLLNYIPERAIVHQRPNNPALATPSATKRQSEAAKQSDQQMRTAAEKINARYTQQTQRNKKEKIRRKGWGVGGEKGKECPKNNNNNNPRLRFSEIWRIFLK